MGLFTPSTFGRDTEKCHAVGEEAGIHTRSPPPKQKLSRHIYQPEQNHSVIKQETLIAMRLTNHATWLQLQKEQALLLRHPMGLPDAGPQGHVLLTLPVPGKGAWDPRGCVQGSTLLAPMDCRDVWGSRGKAMQCSPKLLLAYL